jgi:hypothetical protein
VFRGGIDVGKKGLEEDINKKELVGFYCGFD